MKDYKDPVGLVISRDGTDEVTLYFLKEQAFNDCRDELDSIDENDIHENISLIINEESNQIDQLFTQTFCYKDVHFTYNIIGIITIPGY